MKKEQRLHWLALAALAASSPLALAGQPLVPDVPLSLTLATEAAQEAVRACESRGYRVSASVVDAQGVERVLLKGDRSTVHTRETAFKKAYTAVTLGPIFGASTTGALTEKISKTPTGPALSNVTNVILLAGGVVLTAGGNVVGAIGVGGAPGGSLDEECAQQGATRISASLSRSLGGD